MSEAVTIDERIALETVDNDLLREVESQWNSDPNNKELELQYALLLAKSHRRDCKKKAIAILSRHLMSRSYTNECLYTISLSYYALHDYEQARNYVEELLRQNTDNSQARELHRAILIKQQEENKQVQDTVTWTAVGVGLAAITAVAVARAFRSK